MPLNLYLFHRPSNNALVLLYINDVLVAASFNVIANAVNHTLGEHYPLRTLRDGATFLGLNIY